MTDPWLSAAQEIRRQQAEQEQAAKKQAQLRATEQQRQQAEAKHAEEMLKAAIDDATRNLEEFMAERGGPAQQLLAARNTYIVFGERRGGGSYTSVILDEEGIREAAGTVGGQTSTTTSLTPALPREAAEYFARYGEGRKDPAKVRQVVGWLERRINNHM